MKEFYARKKEVDKNVVYQTLKDHSFGTLNLAASKIYNSDMKDYIKLAALLHDMGKVSNKFQDKLNGVHGSSVRHAFLGAHYLDTLIRKGLITNKIFYSLQLIIEGHHTNLKNGEQFLTSIKNGVESFNDKEIEQYMKDFITYININSVLQEYLNKLNKYSDINNLEFDILTRLGMSALQDADKSDAHFYETDEHIENNEIDCIKYINILNKYYKLIEKKSKNTYINKLRQKAKQDILENIYASSGIFALNLPTGLGKTLLSIYWALLHARQNGMRRIIYVLPFNTISDQVGEILQIIFGKENVLIDHSGVSKKNEDTPYFVERWNYPIVVTSSVQFFETLFTHRKNRLIKYHNIQKSVVIFDEFQSFPKELMEPTNVMLQDVQKILDCTFLYSTATMPYIGSTFKIKGLDNISLLISDSNKYYEKTKRVIYEHKLNNKLSFEDISKEVMDTKGSVLLITNTKNKSVKIYNHVCSLNKGLNKKHIFHLNGNMLYNDRRRVLRKVKKLLNKKKTVKLISTQVVEAGVDIDFPTVFRETAPFEALIQSAGRCNREGLIDKGKVIIYKLEDETSAGVNYKKQSAYSEQMILNNGITILSDSDKYKNYSRNILNGIEQKNDITEHRSKFNFKTVGDSYQLIPDDTVRVFIYNNKKNNKKLDDIIKQAKNTESVSRKNMRWLGNNSISMFREVVKKYINSGEIIEEVYKEYEVDGEVRNNSIFKWVGKYDKNTGIVINANL